jgi:hypothetical protein
MPGSFCVTFPIPYASTRRKILFGVYPRAVTHLRKLGTLVLLLASFLTPTMACAVADTPMTSEERACCQMMKSQCGEKGMPASHGCCHRIPGSIYDNALKPKAVALHPLAVPVIWLPVHQLEIPTSSVHGWVEPRAYTLLKFPPSTISILRI